jgi:nucleoside 2-deoxyribosyltransferase
MDPLAPRHCWICRGDFLEPLASDGIGYRVDCTTCGVYSVTGSAYHSTFPVPEGERYRVSHWVKQMQLDGRSPPIFNSNTSHLIAASLPALSPADKLDVLLVSLSKVTKQAGGWHQFDYHREHSLACAASGTELQFYVEALLNLAYFQPNSGSKGVRISAKGWQRIVELQTTPLISKRAFVALRFNEEMLGMFKTHIQPAVKLAGFEAEISGTPQHNEKIDARIMTQIKQSRFVIADVTHENNGVYFEAGYAIGLGRPVIWTCRKTEADAGALHFDTRQYNHILWETPGNLASQLADRITATI